MNLSKKLHVNLFSVMYHKSIKAEWLNLQSTKKSTSLNQKFSKYRKPKSPIKCRSYEQKSGQVIAIIKMEMQRWSIETFPGKRHDEGGCKTNGVEASISKFPWNFSTVVPWCVRGVTIMHTRMLIDTCGRRGGKGERGRRRLGPGARREISLIMHSFQVAVIILHIAGGGVPTAFANFSSRAKRNGNLAAACACTRVFHSRTTSLEFKHFAGAYGDRSRSFAIRN